MKIMMIAILLSFSSFSFAGILIEPQLGYVFSSKSTSGTVNLTAANNVTGTLDADYKAKGTEYGGRLGYQIFGLMGGLSYGKTNFKMSDVTSGSDKMKMTNMGAFIGYHAPAFVRLWGAYNFSSKGNLSDIAIKGKSTEFGLGFTSIPFLSLNFIYRQYDIDKITTQGIEFTTASSFKAKEMEFAVSAPFNLF